MEQGELSTEAGLGKRGRASAERRPTLFDVDPGAPRLVDPFLEQRIAPPPKPPISRAALVAALLPFVLGPIGALAAMPVALAGRRHTAPGGLRGRWLANLGLAAGVLGSLAWLIVAVGVVVLDLQDRKLAALRADAGRPEVAEPREVESPPSAPPAADASSSPLGPRPFAQKRLPPDGTVPRTTREAQIGTLTVVDIGVDEPSLRAALEVQRAKARAEGEEIMVMTVASSCVPCEGVHASLGDERMQVALEKIRLVRVDLEVFRDDLSGLKMQAQRYPGYFLLTDDLSPRDAIDGGEWGEDIAENIAPVLGPFARGRYRDRKHEWRGVFL